MHLFVVGVDPKMGIIRPIYKRRKRKGRQENLPSKS